MPYIKPEERVALDSHVSELTAQIESMGQLNYVVTSLVHQGLKKVGLNYASINSMVGVLECAKMELYRQIAAPYEDTKSFQNGPVSDLDSK